MNNLVSKAGDFFQQFKTYWKAPPPGRYVSYKEFAAFILGGSGMSVFNIVLGMVSFASQCMLVGAIFNIAYKHVYIIGLLGIPLSYLLAPVHCMLTDNLGDVSKKWRKGLVVGCGGLLAIAAGLLLVPQIKFESFLPELPKILAIIIFFNVFSIGFKILVYRLFSKKFGKFRPWIFACAIPLFISLVAVVFLPYENMAYNTKLLWVFLLFTLLGQFSGNFQQLGSLQNVISPSSEERTMIMSFGSVAYQALPSLINIIFPILAVATGGLTNVRTYRIFVPIFAVMGISLSLFMAFGIKERVVIAKEHKAKVPFMVGVKSVLSNKYFWITNMTNVVGALCAGSISLTTIIFVYGMRQDWLVGITSAILGSACLPGMIFAPFLIKKVGKKNLVLMTRGVSILASVATLFVVRIENLAISATLIILFSVLQNIFVSSASIALSSMNADIWDYQQYKAGERLDGFSSIFGYIFMPLTMVLGYVVPALYGRFGLTSDWDILFHSNVRNVIFLVTIGINIVNLVIGSIPWLFYDLTDKKHKHIIEELQKRAEAEERESASASSVATVAQG